MIDIEGIIVSVGYSDILKCTLPWTLPIFKKLVIVTSYEDKETIGLARQFGVECRPTDSMYFDGAKFNKARAIDFGLSYLSQNGWILHLDADLWLPPNTLYHLDRAFLDPETIYGIDRMLCKSYDSWRNFIKDGPILQHDYHCRVNVPKGFELGSRISLIDQSGYIPLGFFQLWNGKTNRRYPLHGSTNAERSDVLHSLQWPHNKRQLLGEIIGVHLEASESKLGANWNGRTSPIFGPCQPALKPQSKPYDNHKH